MIYAQGRLVDVTASTRAVRELEVAPLAFR